MDLALVMFLKALVLTAWFVFSEWKWPEEDEPELLAESESSTTTRGRQEFLRLPAPEKPTDLL